MRLWARLLTIEAVRALGRNKVRTALAMVAIMFGVATVIWFAAIGKAGRDAALSEFDNLGDNLVWLEAGARGVNGVRTGTHGMNTLTFADAVAIREECPAVARVSENIDGSVQIIGEERNWNTRWRGVSPDYFAIRKWDIAKGAAFTDDDVARYAKVVILGETVRRQLFGDDDGLDARVRLNGALFRVIGVFAVKGPAANGQDQDDTIMMPWTSSQRFLAGNQLWLDDILMSAGSDAGIPRATRQVVELIRERHHIAPGADDDFNIRHPEELLQAKLKSSETLGRLLLSLASIALIVGGIGIMNLMLASVAQRTREIGLRGAIGATPNAIRVQFLGEAVMLTALGGLLGVILSRVGSFVLENKLGWPMTMSLDATALSCGFALLFGVVFGFYPASRAARLEPVIALRMD